MTSPADVRSPEPRGAIAHHNRLHAWARDTLYGSPSHLSRTARVVGRPFGALWAAAARRRWSNREAGEPLPAPAISVGNVTLGGAGKTPIVQWLLREGLPDGLVAAVLSRGYGRRGSEVLAVSPDDSLEAAVGGDEPALHHRAGVWVGVGVDRRVSALALESRTEIDLFVLDDGLQTLVPRALDIVVFSARDLDAPARCVPAGPLRQPPDARPHHAIWIAMESDPRSNREPGTIAAAFADWWRALPGVVGRWEDGGTAALDAWTIGEERPLSVDAGRRMVVLAGVADPRSVVAFARQAGWDPVAMESFPDHHAWSRRDVARALRGYAADVGVVLTEKDAVKCRPEWFGGRRVGVLRRVPVFDDPSVVRSAVSARLATISGENP